MNDPLVEALRRLVEREGGRHKVAYKIGVNEQSIYQILKGIPLPSGKPRGVGAVLRSKLSAAYPDWLEQPEQRRIADQYPPLSTALPAVLDAIRASPHKEELRVLLPLLVETDAPAYRARLLELLGAQPINALPVDSRDFYPPVPSTEKSREKA